MAKRKWFHYYFTDGYNTMSNFSAREIKGLELDHGPLLAIIPLDD